MTEAEYHNKLVRALIRNGIVTDAQIADAIRRLEEEQQAETVGAIMILWPTQVSEAAVNGMLASIRNEVQEPISNDELLYEASRASQVLSTNSGGVFVHLLYFMARSLLAEQYTVPESPSLSPDADEKTPPSHV